MNIDERNEQVQRMGKISSFAEQVMIWMGTGDEVFGPHETFSELRLALYAAELVDEDESKSFLVEFARLVHIVAGEPQLSLAETEKLSSGLEPEWIGASDTVDDDTKALRSVLRESQYVMPNILHQCREFMRHPYFTRTWVIQEYALGQNRPLALVEPHVLDLGLLFDLTRELWTCRNKFDKQLSAQAVAVLLQSLSMVSLHREWLSHF